MGNKTSSAKYKSLALKMADYEKKELHNNAKYVEQCVKDNFIPIDFFKYCDDIKLIEYVLDYITCDDSSYITYNAYNELLGRRLFDERVLSNKMINFCRRNVKDYTHGGLNPFIHNSEGEISNMLCVINNRINNIEDKLDKLLDLKKKDKNNLSLYIPPN